MAKKYDLKNLMEFGRVSFALGFAQYGYKNLTKEQQSLIASGWDLEYKRNKVRLLKRYEKKPIPDNLEWADLPCINTRGKGIDMSTFKRLQRSYGYV